MPKITYKFLTYICEFILNNNLCYYNTILFDNEMQKRCIMK